MQHGIREFRPRQPLDRQLSSDTLNRILRELESLRITRVVNGTFKKLPGGTEIVVPPQRGGTPVTPQPWDLIARQNPDNENQYFVRVQPGTLNNILPSNWNTTGASGAVDVPCADTGVYYAKAMITTDGSAISALSVLIDTIPPVVQTPQEFALQTSIEYLFGLFSEGNTYRVIGPGHITLSASQWIVASADPAASPGQSPYDIYYSLQ